MFIYSSKKSFVFIIFLLFGISQTFSTVWWAKYSIHSNLPLVPVVLYYLHVHHPICVLYIFHRQTADSWDHIKNIMMACNNKMLSASWVAINPEVWTCWCQSSSCRPPLWALQTYMCLQKIIISDGVGTALLFIFSWIWVCIVKANVYPVSGTRWHYRK